MRNCYKCCHTNGKKGIKNDGDTTIDGCLTWKEIQPFFYSVLYRMLTAHPDTDVWESSTSQVARSAAPVFLYPPDDLLHPTRLHSKFQYYAGWNLAHAHRAPIPGDNGEVLHYGWCKNDTLCPWNLVAGDIVEAALRWRKHCSASRCNESPTT